jgi:hypothetical protein
MPFAPIEWMAEDKKYGRVAPGPTPDDAGESTRRSSRGRLFLVVVVAILLVLAAVLVAFVLPLKSTTQTKVDWFNHQVTADPGIDTNTSTVRGMCPPTDANAVGVFSMTWSTLSGIPVELVRVWTLEGTTPTNLYIASNATAGGTSFLATYPIPSSQPWILTVAANQTTTVDAVATLTYNVAAKVPIL